LRRFSSEPEQLQALFTANRSTQPHILRVDLPDMRSHMDVGLAQIVAGLRLAEGAPRL